MEGVPRCHNVGTPFLIGNIFILTMEIGKINNLIIARATEQGFYLKSAEDGSEVLLPNRYITADMAIGDEIEAFVYNDSEDRPVATTERPNALVGECA